VKITQTPYQNIMLDKRVLKTKKRHVGHKLFLPQEVVFGMKYGLVVFRKCIVIDDDFHGERCNQILTQMSGCNILLSHNLWFKVVEIKMK